jgi:acetylornithine deacetylase
MPAPLDYASELIEFDSVSSKTNVPVTERVDQWLRKLKFDVERVDYTDPWGVPKSNVIGRLGSGPGGVAYFGHTDVVPVAKWNFDTGPFTPTVRDERLYGRGSTDMKGSVACMLAAISEVASRPLREPIYFCCTADEEIGMLGAEQIAENSQIYRELVAGGARGIVGEPTRLEVIHGHKGGCALKITSRGRAAHSSTSIGLSANWQMIPFLAEMKRLRDELQEDSRWQNQEFNPPTMSLNLGISDHNAGLNVTAAESVCQIYFRSMPGIDITPIVNRIHESARSQGLEIEQIFFSHPFYVNADSPFIQECLDFSDRKEAHTVAYGTDAARLTALQQCVIFGPGDIAQAHTQDEWIMLADLERGTSTYRAMLERWCVRN